MSSGSSSIPRMIKKKHFRVKHQKVKLFRANEPILSVFMWGINHTVIIQYYLFFSFFFFLNKNTISLNPYLSLVVLSGIDHVRDISHHSDERMISFWMIFYGHHAVVTYGLDGGRPKTDRPTYTLK